MFEFNFNLKPKDIFDSSLNFHFHSKQIILDIIFTLISVLVTIYTINNGIFFNMELYKRVLLILCCIMFIIIQPVLIYIKSFLRAKKAKDRDINLKFLDNNIQINSSNDSANVFYKDIYDLLVYKNMVVIMYDSIHGQIIPNRVLNNDRNEFISFLKNKIITSRNKND